MRLLGLVVVYKMHRPHLFAGVERQCQEFTARGKGVDASVGDEGRGDRSVVRSVVSFVGFSDFMSPEFSAVRFGEGYDEIRLSVGESCNDVAIADRQG